MASSRSRIVLVALVLSMVAALASGIRIVADADTPDCKNICVAETTCVAAVGECLRLVCKPGATLTSLKIPPLNIDVQNDVIDATSPYYKDFTLFPTKSSIEINEVKGAYGQKITVNAVLEGYVTYNFDVLVYDKNHADAKPSVKFNFDSDIDFVKPKANAEPIKLNATIDSFEDKELTYTFSFETAPVDDLVANGVAVRAKACTNPKDTSLVCLNYTGPLALKHCERQHALSLTYLVTRDADFKKAGVTLTPGKQDYVINLSFPPKLKTRKREIFFEKVGEFPAQLACEVECAYPEANSFVMYDASGELGQSTTQCQFEHKVNVASLDQVFRVNVTAYNGIDSEHLEESTIEYTISYRAPTTTTKEPPATTAKAAGRLSPLEIAAISIGSILLVALVIGAIVLIVFCSKKKKRDAAAAARPKTNLDHELTDNPVYGTRPVMQPAPKTAKVGDKNDITKTEV